MSDHLASLRVAIEGAATRTMDYDPWGSVIAGSSGGERSTFNDQERDGETGLFDLSDRNYDAGIGAFSKPDRLWEKFRAVSPYLYCNDNPVRLTDPDGMQVRGVNAIMNMPLSEAGGVAQPTSQSNVPVAVAEGYTIHQGYTNYKAGALRQEYISRVSGLATDESAMRTAIMRDIREKSPPVYRAIAESMRSSSEAPRIGGTANKTNAAVDEMMPKIGAAGKITIGVGVAMSVYHVATADDKPRAVAQEAGGVGGSYCWRGSWRRSWCRRRRLFWWCRGRSRCICRRNYRFGSWSHYWIGTCR